MINHPDSYQILEMDEVYDDLGSVIVKRSGEIISFAKELVKCPSLSGQEGEVSQLIIKKMEQSVFDETFIDRVGNVVGILRGNGEGEHLLLNGHSDHVPPGDMIDPYSAATKNGAEFGVDDEVIYGRGTCDMKSGVACMVMAGAIIKEMNVSLKGDLIITASVLEDASPGHLGTRCLLEEDGLKPHYAVIGEPSNLELSLGNRGSAILKATIQGKSCHASMPDKGINAIYSASRFISQIQDVSKSLPKHNILGKPSMAITDIRVEPGYPNVIPNRCVLTIDTRLVPNFSSNEFVQQIKTTMDTLKAKDDSFDGAINIDNVKLKSYTGFDLEAKAVQQPFFTEYKERIVKRGIEAIKRVRGSNPPIKYWQFGTDGGFFFNKGIPTIGFGPGDEKFAHTSSEHIKINDLIEAVKVYSSLAIEFCMG